MKAAKLSFPHIFTFHLDLLCVLLLSYSGGKKKQKQKRNPVDFEEDKQ